MPNWATAENENGQLYETAGDALLSVATRFREGRLECEECERPIPSTLGPEGFVIAVYPERTGWNVDVLHTVCDRAPVAPTVTDIKGLTDICDGQAVDGSNEREIL